ncbi:MAG: YihY/virulence factor BrkB family protein [Peptoniphilus sp.]|nr:YihY/virulence factor BrkB family protein [Peptoniphilus sp.]MDY3119086.1 YihY/virulence factor BrkB family protein [Peptoniphilus sp.]
MNKWKRKLKGFVTKKPFAFFDIFLYQVVKNNLMQKAASLSYFFVLAIFPFFIALLNILNVVNRSYLPKIAVILENLPPEIQSIATGFFKDLELNSSSTLLSISLIGSIYVASKGIKQLIKSINDSLDISENRTILSLTALSLVTTVALFALVVLLFVTQVIGTNLLRFLFGFFQLPQDAYVLIRHAATFLPVIFMFLSFYGLYRFSPKWPESARPKARIHLAGALFATVGILLSNAVFSFYVANFSNYSNTYGSLAGMIVFLVWLYLFGLILLFGASVQASLYILNTKGAAWPREETLFSGLVATHRKLI